MTRSDYLYAAAYFFERERGRPMDDAELACIRDEGLDQAGSTELRRVLEQGLVSGGWSANERSLACFALGKTFDSTLTPLLQRQLRIEWEERSCAVYQIMICLSDLGEEVFATDRGGSLSSMDVELNLRDAEAYLNRLR